VQYVRKVGASALVVAAAFAVAFAVLISSSDKVEAGLSTLDPADAATPEDTIHLGDTIKLELVFGTDGKFFRVDPDSPVEGIFKHSGRSDVECEPDLRAQPNADPAVTKRDNPCDVGADPTDDTTDGMLTLEFTVTKVTYHSTDGADIDVMLQRRESSAAEWTDVTTTDVTVYASGTVATTDARYYAHAHAVSASPGSTVTVTFETGANGGHTRAGTRYRISTDSVGKATFDSNSATSIVCDDVTGDTTGKCDTDKAGDRIGLRIAIAEDSPRGEIFVQRFSRTINSDGEVEIVVDDEIAITVAGAATQAATLKASAANASIAATGGSTTINVELIGSDGSASAGRGVTLIASGVGTFSDDDCGATDGTQFCKVNTDAQGKAAIGYTGARSSGTATITVTAGGLSKQVTITLHGGADSIAAEMYEGTIQKGGEANYVVVTVLDKTGQPIEGASPTVKSTTGPVVENDRDVDLNPAGTANDIPACGDDPDGISSTTGLGANKNGQCVIELMAPKTSETGEHTITVQLARTGKTPLTAEATVEVVDKPASLVVTAPESVEPLSETAITVTVYDENGNLAGKNTVSARKIDGDGAIDKADVVTKNGVATFKYFAPSSGSVIVRFEVANTAANERIAITIAAAEADEPEPEPVVEAPSLTPAPAGALTLSNFSGGTVDELAAALASCESGAGAYAAVGGSWLTYLPGAPAPVNAAFAAHFADGIPAGQGLVILNCGG